MFVDFSFYFICRTLAVKANRILFSLSAHISFHVVSFFSFLFTICDCFFGIANFLCKFTNNFALYITWNNSRCFNGRSLVQIKQTYARRARIHRSLTIVCLHRLLNGSSPKIPHWIIRPTSLNERISHIDVFFWTQFKAPFICYHWRKINSNEHIMHWRQLSQDKSAQYNWNDEHKAQMVKEWRTMSVSAPRFNSVCIKQ